MSNDICQSNENFTFVKIYNCATNHMLAALLFILYSTLEALVQEKS